MNLLVRNSTESLALSALNSRDGTLLRRYLDMIVGDLFLLFADLRVLFRKTLLQLPLVFPPFQSRVYRSNLSRRCSINGLLVSSRKFVKQISIYRKISEPPLRHQQQHPSHPLLPFVSVLPVERRL